MILMNNTQILSAVVKGLEQNIAPELKTDYAQVQLMAAVKAVQEVIHRLEQGDPCLAENERLEALMLGLADSLRDDSPDVASGLKAGIEAAASVEDPREKNRVLKEEVWGVIRDSDKADAQKVLAKVMENHMATIGEDAAWVCAEAVKQLS